MRKEVEVAAQDLSVAKESVDANTKQAPNLLLEEQKVARTRILDALSSSQNLSFHQDVIAFCSDHELVEKAHELIERLGDHHRQLEDLHRQIWSIRNEIFPQNSQCSDSDTFNSSKSHVIESDSSKHANFDGQTVAKEQDGSNVIPQRISTEMQANLAAQSRLMHTGVQAVGDVLKTYTLKVARDAIESQRLADHERSEYEKIRRRALHYARRRLGFDSLFNRLNDQNPTLAPSNQPASNWSIVRPGATALAYNRSSPRFAVKIGLRRRLTSETESESDTDSGESVIDLENNARIEIGLARRLKTRFTAFQVAQCDALAKMELAATYRSRTLDRAFSLLLSLQLSFYSSSGSSLEAKESHLRGILHGYRASLPDDIASDKQRFRSAFVESVVSLLGSPSVRAASKSLADAHRRALSKSRRPESLNSLDSISSKSESSPNRTLKSEKKPVLKRDNSGQLSKPKETKNLVNLLNVVHRLESVTNADSACSATSGANSEDKADDFVDSN